MVRFAGQTQIMENREELLDALNDFSRKQPKEIPPLLEQFLKQVAKTGETLFPWTVLKALFVTKLEQVMGEFNEECMADEIPTCPNVENARFEVYRARIMEAVHRFHGAPFTIQRLCELLTDPKRHYKRCDKFMRGLEKNVLVVSTVDPFGRKVVSESKNLVNGMDGNNSSSEGTSTPATTTTPPVPSWPSPSSSSSSPTTSWPVQADLITPSTAPLLEVCDLPDPKEHSPATGTAPTATEPLAVNGHDSITSASSVEVATDSSAVPSTPSADVSVVTSMEETVDSSDQQVAAEEMVGVEEEAATSTAISQEAAGVVEETVVETTPVAADVMKDTNDVTESGGEVTPAASGDWLVNITDKGTKSEPSSTDSEDNSGTESQNCSVAESSEASGAESQDSSPEKSLDSSCAESQDGSGAESKPSSEETDSPVTAAEMPAVEPSTDSSPADTSVQAETDSSDAEVSSSKEEGGVKGMLREEGKDDGEVEETFGVLETGTPQEGSTDASSAEDSTEAKTVDTVTTGSVISDSLVTDTSTASSTTPSVTEKQAPSAAEEQVPPESSASNPDSAEVNMAASSEEISTSENIVRSTCPSVASGMEASNSSASDAADTTTCSTTVLSSTVSSASSTEEKSEECIADSSSTTPMETDCADYCSNVPKAAENGESEVVASSTEGQQEAPSADDSSQAEPMEQD